MNVVTPYPTNIPLNTANVATESARRDNLNREVIKQPSGTEAGARERGVANEQDKARPGQPNPNSFDGSLRNAEGQQRIGERGQGQGQGKEEQEKEKQEAEKKAQDARKRIDALQKQEAEQVRKLKARDQEVRTHEQAHAAVGGQYAGSPSYEFERGPDGRNYAVGGEVQIDTAPVAGDPEATVKKMQTVRAAALAPAEPSGQDRKVAAQATAAMSQAQAEALQKQADEAQIAREEQAAQTEQATQGATEGEGTETTQAAPQVAQAQPVDVATAQTPSGVAPAGSQDPFNLTEDNEQGINVRETNEVLGQVFGVAGDDNTQAVSAAPQGAQAAQATAASASASAEPEQRDSQVVARASRIQNFYATSTVPRERGFSQFA